MIAANENNLLQTTSKSYVLHSNGSLEINRVAPKDTGEYMCEVVRNHPWSPVRQIHAIEVLRNYYKNEKK